jgi:hypothetical protein
MPRCSVRLMRVTMPFMLSVLILLGLTPGARSVQAQIWAVGLVPATLSPAISLSAASGGVGTSASLSGHGFQASDSLNVTFDGTRVTSCAADAAGSLVSCPLIIPDASAGAHNVVVADSAGNAASVPFTIVPVLSLSTAAGPVGGLALAAGRGFAAFALIRIAFDGTGVAFCTADVLGTLSACAFTVPVVGAGVHSIQAKDSSGDVASASFSVIPVISLAAGAGASAVLWGWGFAALGTVAVTFDGTAVASCMADTLGTVSSCAFTVPLSAAGLHSISAVDSSGHTAIASFSVSPALSLSPSAGMVGSRAVLDARGFAASRVVKVMFDGVLITSCATDLRGTLSGCAFVIPPVVSGAHRVAAIDSSGHAVSLPFTIT